MKHSDIEEFKTMIGEMAAMYRHTVYNDFMCNGYWKVLQPYPMDAIRRACLDLMGNEMRPGVMPGAAEIKSLAKRLAPTLKANRALSDEEAWRRRYDVWQRGRFSAEALGVACTLNDEALGVGLEGDETMIQCQSPECPRFVPWPSASGHTRCPTHQEAERHGPPITHAENVEMAKGLTAKGRAFLRAAVPSVMRDIPITTEEEACQERPLLGIPMRLMEHLDTVDGPTARAILENYGPQGED